MARGVFIFEYQKSLIFYAHKQVFS